MSKKINSGKKRFTARRFLRLVGIILAATALSAVFVFAFGDVGFKNPFDNDVNKDNLIDVSSDNYIRTHSTGRGVEVNVDDDGVIKLSGKATSDFSVVVTTMTLEPGTYTLSGVQKPNIDEFGMRLRYGNGDVAFADTDNGTFTIAEAQTVTIELYWVDDYTFNVFTNYKVTPTLVSGSSAGSFYN